MLENRSSSAWFELAATHFIRSDLAMHAVQDASYLDSERKLSEGTQIPIVCELLPVHVELQSSGDCVFLFIM